MTRPRKKKKKTIIIPQEQDSRKSLKSVNMKNNGDDCFRTEVEKLSKAGDFDEGSHRE